MTDSASRRPWSRRGLALVGGTLGLLLAGRCILHLGPPSTRNAFEGRPQPSLHAYACADGASVASAETGPEDGPPVLLVHGTPGSWRAFAFVMADARLAERARLIAVDRPGWGGSSASGTVTSLSAQASALCAVLRGRRPAVVVGHSLGGPIAVRLALDSPELVRALVLVAPALDPELEVETWYQALARTWLVRPLLPSALARADRELAPLRGELEALLPLWSALHTPVYVLQGEEDALVPAANADFAARVITAAPLEIRRLPDQGHLIPWECPERIVDAVLEALAGP